MLLSPAQSSTSEKSSWVKEKFKLYESLKLESLDWNFFSLEKKTSFIWVGIFFLITKSDLLSYGTSWDIIQGRKRKSWENSLEEVSGED